MISRLADVEHRVKVGRLAGGRQHGAHAALQLTYLRRHRVAGGVRQTGVKISVLLQIKQTSHLLAGGVFKCGALVDGKLTGFPVFRLPSSLYADRVQ